MEPIMDAVACVRDDGRDVRRAARGVGHLARDARLLAGAVIALSLAAGLAGSASGQGLPGNALLIEHWNGAVWKLTPAVSPRRGGELRAVTAISRNNLWAVGSTPSKRGAFPLAEHYNGKSWSPVVLPSPNKNASSDLDAASAASAKDVWAVGSIGPHVNTLIEHFDGKAWKVVPSPQVVGFKLMGVAAVTRRDAWAVGSLAVKTKNSRLLIEHWNGSSWRRVPSPNPTGPEDELVAISARSARDIWAVGDHRAGNHTRTLVLHWDGRRWQQVAGPGPPATDSSLWGVTTIGAKDVWAVGPRGTRVTWPSTGTVTSGESCRCRPLPARPRTSSWLSAQHRRPTCGRPDRTASNRPRRLVVHWNGHAWTSTSAPTIGRDNSFSGIAAVSSNDVWAVGVDHPLESLR